MKLAKRIDMFKEYVIQLILRCVLFLAILAAYIFRPEYFDVIATEHKMIQLQLDGLTLEQITSYISQFNIVWVIIIWGIFMLSMLIQMIPESRRITMGAKKNFERFYKPVKNYSKLSMYEYKREQDLGALKVLLLWVAFNSIFGLLYVFRIIDVKELILISAAYYVCDLICVVIWCPFQTFIMKNRCCVNCRIFNWGYFMIFTPMVFIRNFFTWSLFFMSIVLLLRWEFTLLMHPERFWSGSNQRLQCKHCRDRMCKFKGPTIIAKINRGEKIENAED